MTDTTDTVVTPPTPDPSAPVRAGWRDLVHGIARLGAPEGRALAILASEYGPQTRADEPGEPGEPEVDPDILAEALGVQRSRAVDLIGNLSDLGWLTPDAVLRDNRAVKVHRFPYVWAER